MNPKLIDPMSCIGKKMPKIIKKDLILGLWNSDFHSVAVTQNTLHIYYPRNHCPKSQEEVLRNTNNIGKTSDHSEIVTSF